MVVGEGLAEVLLEVEEDQEVDLVDAVLQVEVLLLVSVGVEEEEVDEDLQQEVDSEAVHLVEEEVKVSSMYVEKVVDVAIASLSLYILLLLKSVFLM